MARARGRASRAVAVAPTATRAAPARGAPLRPPRRRDRAVLLVTPSTSSRARARASAPPCSSPSWRWGRTRDHRPAPPVAPTPRAPAGGVRRRAGRNWTGSLQLSLPPLVLLEHGSRAGAGRAVLRWVTSGGQGLVVRAARRYCRCAGALGFFFFFFFFFFLKKKKINAFSGLSLRAAPPRPFGYAPAAPFSSSRTVD